MANPTDPFSLNMQGVSDLVSNETNKTDFTRNGLEEGPVGEKYGALALSMPDDELLKLRDEWELRYAPYESKIKAIFERNKESYIGKRPNGQWLTDQDLPISANLQFEAEETFLASALSKNPEPTVYSDDTPEGDTISRSVRVMLAYHADQLVLRRKLALMVRQWSIYHLGVLKYGWNKQVNDVTIDNRKIQDFVFDPNGYVDAYGDFIGYLGERIKVTAEKLIEMFPDKKSYISESVEGKLGTEVKYTEWWSADDTYTFITYKEIILDKYKNPYFNYPEPVVDPLTGEVAVNGNNSELEQDGKNHFAIPKKPYVFLSVFSLQEQPHDITSLVEQNIPNQNRIRRRTEQIDYNTNSANNAYAFSGDNFNEETAKQAAAARAKGNPILVPAGKPMGEAIMPLNAQDLPRTVFNELEIAKTDLRQSWGILGMTTQPSNEDMTARGMILNNQNDSTRIGGGIGQAIEQVADNVFNSLTQLYYVFYDEPHFASVMGTAKSLEYVQLQNSMLVVPLLVSVSPDSLRPRDQITEINLAQTLFDKGVIGPKTLLKMLSFPSPDDSATDGLLYKLDPMSYMMLNFPDFAMQLQMAQQQQQMMQTQGNMQAGLAPDGTAPEDTTEPKQNLAQNPADAGLDQVQLPPM
jgi:hypothetical protein